MTNDMTVNDIPCTYRQLESGMFRVEFQYGQRGEIQAKQLRLGQSVMLCYCDREIPGIIGEIVWQPKA